MIWQGIEQDISDIHNGLLGFYNFEETTFTSPFGDAVNGNDVSAFNGVPSTSGIVGSGRSFDGSQDYGSLSTGPANGPIYQFGPNDSFTISAWVNLDSFMDSSEEHAICAKHDTNPIVLETDYSLSFRDEQSSNFPKRFALQLFDDDDLSVRTEVLTGKFNAGLGFQGSPYDIFTGQWYHIIAGYDDDEGHAFMYVNNAVSGAPNESGESDGELGGRIVNDGLSQGLGASATNAGFSIGAFHTADGKFHGIIDCLGIWNRVLSSGEIKALYNDGQGLSLPFTDFPASGVQGIGGYALSDTPTEVTVSGTIGGYLFSPTPVAPSGNPLGISPQIGSYMFAPRQWPVQNPNSGSSSGIASLGDTSSLSGYWTFNQASGDIRDDIAGRRSLIPSPYKWEFKGDKNELNTGLSGYWPMDDWRLFRRQDVVGANHLTPNDADSNKVVTVPGSLSGAEVNRLNSAFYTRSSPTDSLNIASGDLTVAFWTESHTVELNLAQGYVSKWDPGANLREWTLFRQANNASNTARAGRMNFAVSDDPTLNRLQIAASGDGTAPRFNQAGVPYFVAARFNVASGITNITVASGSDSGGTWDSRIFNQSDPEPQLESGLSSTSVTFRVGTGVGFEEIRGSIAGVGVWRKYLTDSELELLYGSGLGQQVKPIDNANSQLISDHSEDPLGPNGDSSIKKLGTRSAEYNQQGGTGGGSTDVGMFKLEHGQGGEFFDFDGSVSFTFAGWVRFNNTNTQVILSKNSIQDGQRGYMLRRNNNDGRIDWMMSNSAGTSLTALEISSTFTSANIWYFVVCGWDKNSGKMFGSLNAAPMQEVARASFGRSSAPFIFGQGNSSLTSLAPLRGRTDAWGLWSKRLSQAEIDFLYNSGNGIELSSGDLDLSFDPLFADYDQPGNKIGGFLFSKPGSDQLNNAKFGGYTKAPGFEKADTFLGGLVFAQPLTSKPAENVGGLASGLNQFGPDDEQGVLPRIGGWTFGRPAESNFIEQHSRTIVKVRSEDVVDQALDLDSQLILFDTDRQDFNAKLIAFSRANADFNAKLNIQNIKTLPSSTLSITSSTDNNDVTQVEVIASGINSQNNTFFTNATIDFGEPYGFGGSFGNGGFGNETIDSSISGFSRTTLQSTNNVASGIHNYNYPGKYIIVASFVDNLGQVTSNAFLLNTIVSGSIDSVSGTPVEGTDYPALDISGIPRQGLVPPSFDVDFQMRASGTGGPVGTAVNKLNKSSPQTNKHLSWNFNNGIMSTIKQPFSTYFNPGLYIPTARYQFIHPSGTLTSGVYSSKPIWISDSLVIGFGK